MFKKIRNLVDGLETSLHADGLVSKSSADGLETSLNYAHSCDSRVCSLVKSGVLHMG